MFLTFLNNPYYNNLELSVFLAYPPDWVLEFFHQDDINISLPIYQELKSQFADPNNLNENVPKWVLFIDKLLNMETSLDNLEEDHNLQYTGPAYYTKTNTRFFFYKSPFEHEGTTADDISQLMELNITPAIDDLIAKYYATLKCKPSSRKTREELIYDLNICISALKASEIIYRQIEFQKKLLEEREKFLNAPYAALVEPDRPEDKPEKPNKRSFRFKGFLSRKSSRIDYSEACEQHNHALKLYFIKYREYEKACDNYKNALKDWEVEKNHLINRTIEDIKKAKLKIKKGNRILKIYNEVLKSLDIHPSYQNLEAFNRFCYLLETGRASSLQECMNLYEQEQRLEELKKSQERIERNIMATVYYLNSEVASTLDDNLPDSANALIESIYKRLREGFTESN